MPNCLKERRVGYYSINLQKKSQLIQSEFDKSGNKAKTFDAGITTLWRTQ